jgi:hypothetical protein
MAPRQATDDDAKNMQRSTGRMMRETATEKHMLQVSSTTTPLSKGWTEECEHYFLAGSCESLHRFTFRSSLVVSVDERANSGSIRRRKLPSSVPSS